MRGLQVWVVRQYADPDIVGWHVVPYPELLRLFLCAAYEVGVELDLVDLASRVIKQGRLGSHQFAIFFVAVKWDFHKMITTSSMETLCRVLSTRAFQNLLKAGL